MLSLQSDDRQQPPGAGAQVAAPTQQIRLPYQATPPSFATVGGINSGGRPCFDLPSPPQGVPWLVYPSEGIDPPRQKFFCIVDGRMEERFNHHFRHSICLATAYGWMLFDNSASQKVYLFNPSSSQRCPLPRLIDEEPDIFLISSDPSKDGCFIVGVYFKENPYFLYTSPRGKSWNKHELNIGDDYDILAVASCNGKVYLLNWNDVLVIIQFTPLPTVQYFYTEKKQDEYILSGSCSLVSNLVASFGDLFLVETIIYSSTKSDLLRTMKVSKLDFSSMSWVPTEILNDSVFLISRGRTSSFLTANTKLKGNCIYSVYENALYCFDMKYRSLTVSSPTSDTTFNTFSPFWFLLDDTQVNHEQDGDRIREEARSLTCSYEKFIFDHPKFLMPPTSRSGGHIIKCSKLFPRWHPRTPWLMFTNKDDGTYKVLDPCTKVAYELLVPELSGSMIFGSIDGWLFVQDRFFNFLLINPFSKQRIDLPNSYNGSFSIAFSAPPTNQECMIFCISQPYEGEPDVKISVYHSGDDKWTSREFENNIAFKLAHSNAVYLNGYFYCLGMNGYLGIYDPAKDSWHVYGTLVNIESEAHNCTLVESCGKLLSVFIDLLQRPIGMFEFDLELWRWKQVTNMGDRTFFFGQGTSYCVTSASESMRNMIYFPTFQKECSLDLVTYPLSSIGSVLDSSISTKIGYIHLWMEPKLGVLCGLDSITGNVLVL